MTTGAVWALSGYADVHAALRDDRLAPYGVSTRDDSTHKVVRSAVAQELPAERLTRWRVPLGARADALLSALSTQSTVDLVADVAEPWARDASQVVLGLPAAVVDGCMPLARTLFRESAVATRGAPSDALSQAARALAVQLDAFGAAGTVQSFVALTHTVPSLVASAYYALLQHPTQLVWLRKHHDATSLTMSTNELLRFAGPSRALFRTALAPLTIGDISVDVGDEVVLLLSQANRDPIMFTDPDRLDLQRAESGHLAFGAGAHGCVGASMVCMLLQESIAAFARSSRAFELDARDGAGVLWLDGFALRAPRAVPTVVRERRATS